MRLVLDRYKKTKDCTLGELLLIDNKEVTVFKCDTLERPDYNNDGIANNEKGRSCIPEGKYTCCKRVSQIVKRSFASYTSSGKDKDMMEYLKQGFTFEIGGVKGRDNILIHPANYVRQLKGCVAVGTKTGGEPGIDYCLVNSRKAFMSLSTLLRDYQEIELEVNSPSDYYKQQS